MIFRMFVFGVLCSICHVAKSFFAVLSDVDVGIKKIKDIKNRAFYSSQNSKYELNQHLFVPILNMIITVI